MEAKTNSNNCGEWGSVPFQKREKNVAAIKNTINQVQGFRLTQHCFEYL
jgi:hypothetical protein